MRTSGGRLEWVGSGFVHLAGSLSLLLPQVCDGNPDCELSNEAEASLDEQDCGVWGSWGPWEPCSQTCGPGIQGRSRRCSPSRLPVLQNCPGPQHQSQACFSEACPGEGRDVWEEEGAASPEERGGNRGCWSLALPEALSSPTHTPSWPCLVVNGEWSSWSPWSQCSEPCGGTMTRHRQCRPPQNGGQDCALLPGSPRGTHQASE